MRNIDASSYLKDPDLEVVQTKTSSAAGASFVLFAQQAGSVEEQPAAKGKSKSKRVASAQGK
jgi:hypothetical protein